MAKEIIWTPESIDEFEKVVNYLLDEWNESVARDFVNETYRIIELIAENPKLFRQTTTTNIYEALITPHNLIIYKIYSDRIDIITFWDTRRDPLKKKY